MWLSGLNGHCEKAQARPGRDPEPNGSSQALSLKPVALFPVTFTIPPEQESWLDGAAANLLKLTQTEVPEQNPAEACNRKAETPDPQTRMTQTE